MVTSTPTQGSHFSDGVRTGPVLNSKYNVAPNVLLPSTLNGSPLDSVPPGVYMTPTSLLDIIPAAVSATALAAAQTMAAAGYVTLVTTTSRAVTVLSSFGGYTGPAGASVFKLDVPRNVTITGLAGSVATNFTVFGLDQYGMPMVEQIAYAGGAVTTAGKKAFYVIRGVYAQAGTTDDVSVGIGNVFGLPYYVPQTNYLFTHQWNNVLAADAGTFVAGDPVATLQTDNTYTSGATNGDVRGTYAPSDAADGLKRLTLNFYSASGDIRNYNNDNGVIMLNNNPIGTTNLSATVVVTAPNHQLTNGEKVTIAGATATGGISAANLNLSNVTVAVVNANQFSFTAGAAATSTATGGGAAVTMTPGRGNLYQTPIGRFGVAQYSIDLI